MIKDSLENKIVKFDITKNMKCIKKLGQGGTGSTYLFLDESVDMKFAIKKYLPLEEQNRDIYFKRFIEEIKILFRISNDNIVRIYSYYLYPEVKTGYIQMEYIEGETIDKINPEDFGKSWNEYFVDTINAFDYLYEKGILHRDIRASNFMIDKLTGTLKIIDFGFGKKIEKDDNPNSICLNWPATIHPEEVITERDYNYSTEIYYIGELFKHLVKNDNTFLYNEILKKMLEYSPDNRYKNYKQIQEDISNDLLSQISFSDSDRELYQNFADDLHNSISKFITNPTFINDLEKIRTSLEKIVRISSLEKYVQNNNDVISCFVETGYRYKTKKTIETEHLIGFYRLLVNSIESRKKIIIDSIIARLRSIPIEIESAYDEEELPF